MSEDDFESKKYRPGDDLSTSEDEPTMRRLELEALAATAEAGIE